MAFPLRPILAASFIRHLVGTSLPPPPLHTLTGWPLGFSPGKAPDWQQESARFHTNIPKIMARACLRGTLAANGDTHLRRTAHYLSPQPVFAPLPSSSSSAQSLKRRRAEGHPKSFILRVPSGRTTVQHFSAPLLPLGMQIIRSLSLIPHPVKSETFSSWWNFQLC